MIEFEADVLKHLNLPSIPLKSWNGKDGFDSGVAVVLLTGERFAYAVASYDPETDEKPVIRKTFSIEPFYGIKDIFVVPSYMDTTEDSIENSDLDKESKDAARKLAREVEEMENEDVESDEMKEMKSLPEWVFDNVHNADEARAFISSYNSRNKIRGKLPKNEETLKLRLLTIYKEMNNKNK